MPTTLTMTKYIPCHVSYNCEGRTHGITLNRNQDGQLMLPLLRCKTEEYIASSLSWTRDLWLTQRTMPYLCLKCMLYKYPPPPPPTPTHVSCSLNMTPVMGVLPHSKYRSTESSFPRQFSLPQNAELEPLSRSHACCKHFSTCDWTPAIINYQSLQVLSFNLCKECGLFT